MNLITDHLVQKFQFGFVTRYQVVLGLLALKDNIDILLEELVALFGDVDLPSDDS